MKTAISIPDDLFEAADRAAERLGLSRSELYQRAIARFLDDESQALVTDALNEVYRSGPSALDPVLDRLQWAGLSKKAW